MKKSTSLILLSLALLAIGCDERTELTDSGGILLEVEFASSGRTPEERGKELTPLLEARLPRGGTDIAYAGMNDIQFSIMMVTALGVGFITPPLGLNLFVISGITGESVLRIASRVGPYVIGMLLVVLMIAYIPGLSTVFLPDIY